jgi:hypothetical protein
MKWVWVSISFFAGLLAATLFFGFGNSSRAQKQALVRLSDARATVERSLNDRYARLAGQLGEFARTVSGDQAFAMKLIAEHDRSAPEVSEIAQRYMAAMGFSLLEVADSSMTLLSCGQFPAAAGNPVKSAVAQLDTVPAFVQDDIQGSPALTLQAKVRCLIAESPVYCLGGIIVDNGFVAHCAPNDNVRLLLRQGRNALGEGMKTMSEIKNGTIVVNDTTWLVSPISLPWAGQGNAPEILVMMARPSHAIFGL